MTNLAQDLIIAAADLVDRSGGTQFEIGHTPGRKPKWNASAYFQGSRIIVDGHATPTAAALALGERILHGSNCRCGQTVTLNDAPGCRWRLVGPRWEPGCDAQPIKATAERGDLEGLRADYKRHTGKDALL